MSDKNGNINSITENTEETSDKNEENINKEENNPPQEVGDINNYAEKTGQIEGIKYTILKDDYPVYDLSFKLIIIGNSGNYLFYF